MRSEFANAPCRNWLYTAEILADKKLITPTDLSAVARIYAFGQFIGNNDMHFGNLSFFVDEVERDVRRPALRLAPVYDMLPMMWRPDVQSGELNVTAVAEQSVSHRTRAIGSWRVNGRFYFGNKRQRWMRLTGR